MSEEVTKNTEEEDEEYNGEPWSSEVSGPPDYEREWCPVGPDDEAISATNEWNKILHDAMNGVPRVKSRIAFLSSQSRRYFPQDLGHSRFGIQHALNCHPTDVPNPQYYPNDDRLKKPVSKKGYGFGGRTTSRFPKDVHEDTPAPNAYQHDWTVPPPKKIVPIKAPNFTPADMRTLKEPIERKSKTHAILAAKYNKRKLLKMCTPKAKIAFNSHLALPRFPRDAKFRVGGPGTYNGTRPSNCLDLKKAHSFGKRPVILAESNVTRCNYEGHDKCYECCQLLETTDYYRTLTPVRNPYFGDCEPPLVQELDAIGLDAEKLANCNSEFMFVSLCRSCYCKSIRGESEAWDPKIVKEAFHKTRHCSYVHDHQNLPDMFIRKADCSYLKALRRKEMLLTKHHKDVCEAVVKPRN